MGGGVSPWLWTLSLLITLILKFSTNVFFTFHQPSFSHTKSLECGAVCQTRVHRLSADERFILNPNIQFTAAHNSNKTFSLQLLLSPDQHPWSALLLFLCQEPGWSSSWYYWTMVGGGWPGSGSRRGVVKLEFNWHKRYQKEESSAIVSAVLRVSWG